MPAQCMQWMSGSRPRPIGASGARGTAKMQWEIFIYQKRIIRYTVKRACALIRIFIAILTIRDRVSRYAHAAGIP